MSDNIKLIIEIPKETYKGIMLGKWDGNGLAFYVKTGTLLDDVKADIQRTITASWYNGENYKKNYRDGLDDALKIIDKHLADMRGE